MRSGPNNRRSRGRGNSGRGNRPQRNNNFDSSGPDTKVRGTAQQVVDKYQALAREAATAGDPVKAENYYQHAEHYYRVLSASGGSDNRQDQQQRDNNRNNQNNNTEQVAANGAQKNGMNGHDKTVGKPTEAEAKSKSDAEVIEIGSGSAEATKTDEVVVGVKVVQESATEIISEEAEETKPV